MNGRIRFVLLVLAGGFLMTAFEVRYLHREVIGYNPVAWIPVVYGVLAAIACLLGMAKKGPLKLVAGFILLLSLPIGAIGFWNHTRENPQALTDMLTVATSMPSARREEHEERERREEVAPAIAPLSLAGLGLIGLVLVWPSRGRSSVQ